MILIIYAHTRNAGIEDYTQKSYNVQTGIEGKIVMYIHGYEYCLFICSEQCIYSWAAIYTVYLYSIFSMAI